MEQTSQYQCFGGTQGFYKHRSSHIGLPMRFSVYMPPRTTEKKLPVLFYLAGLTCNHETFAIKAGAQRYAAEHGVILVAPDTSPRDTGIPGATGEMDIGESAGFYLDATQSPWSLRFRMYSYIVDELLDTVLKHFPANSNRVGIFGHSMGGHGALVLALRNPILFRSVSALAPICAPSLGSWGRKAFSTYLGEEDQAQWERYDACALMHASLNPFPDGILIDQGLSDQFLPQRQLLPEHFENACERAHQPLTLRRHEGYDHGYFFVQSFVGDHIAYHAKILKG